MTTRTGAGARLSSVVGWLLLLSGVAAGAWILWQLVGTDVVARRDQEALVDATELSWRGDRPQSAASTDAVAEAVVRIPAWGQQWSRPLLVGFDDATLNRSVGRLPEGAAPGAIGNLVVAGHRITHGSPFRDLAELRAGDEVVVETRDVVHTYVLDGTVRTVDLQDSWPLYPVPEEGAREQEATAARITLVTCAELFHTRDRWVVSGTLVSSVVKEQAPAQASR